MERVCVRLVGWDGDGDGDGMWMGMVCSIFDGGIGYVLRGEIGFNYTLVFQAGIPRAGGVVTDS
jgi:hypothetical protein